jgi:hypothetical protein
MSNQKIDISRDAFQNKILDLEKKYFNLLYDVISSDSFKEDLLAIEKEMKTNYGEYKLTWKSVNKINIMTERLIYHNIYTQLRNIIKGIYPSPISSDLGVRTDECILCIDAKTINIKTNKGDLSSTQLENNQCSFDNKGYLGVQTKANLKATDYFHDTELPVLTFVIKIIYSDDTHSFKLNKSASSPTIVLACIPNGELSELFDYNIIENYKTYNYYSETDGKQYSPIYFPDNKSSEEIKEFITNECELKRNFILMKINNKFAYLDPVTKITWWETSNGNKKCIRAVKSGSNVRVKNDYLKKRYDSKNQEWLGYNEIKIY